MSEKVQQCGVQREEGFLYFLQGVDLYRRKKTPGAVAELVVKGSYEKEEGYFYFLDTEGDIVRAKMAKPGEASEPAAPAPARKRAAPSENTKKSKELIAAYLGKRVTAKLDGTLFDHVPATFRFRFHDPKKLAAQLAQDYSDELGEMDCLDDDGNWKSETLIPVASVSKLDDEEDDEPYEFAWVFLDWSVKRPPGVRVTTTDDWGDERTAPGLAALKLKVG